MHYFKILKQELSTAKTYEHNMVDEKYVIDRHRCHMTAKFGVFVDEDNSKHVTLTSAVKFLEIFFRNNFLKVSKGAKIRNRYTQVPHLTQDTNGKVTKSQWTPQ